MRNIFKLAASLVAIAAVPASAATITNVANTLGSLTVGTVVAGDNFNNDSPAFSNATQTAFILNEGVYNSVQSFLLHYDRNGGDGTTVIGSFDIILGAGETFLGLTKTRAGLLASDPANGAIYSASQYRGLENDDFIITELNSVVSVSYKLVNGTTLALDEGRFKIGVSSAIPEPANWAMMIAGFGLVGAAMRRRRTIATVTA